MFSNKSQLLHNAFDNTQTNKEKFSNTDSMQCDI